MSLFHPERGKQQAEQVVRSHIRQEQHEEERAEHEASRINVCFIHDPYWRSRFWSIQHVHDAAEGTKFHWFWTPLMWLFWLSQIMFVVLPLAEFSNRHGSHLTWLHLIILSIGIELLFVAFQNFLEWFHWFRFRRAMSKKEVR